MMFLFYDVYVRVVILFCAICCCGCFVFVIVVGIKPAIGGRKAAVALGFIFSRRNSGNSKPGQVT